MLALLIGVSIGLILGLTGAGGSVLAVPLLVFVLHTSPDSAVAISLATVFASALFGVFTRLKQKQIVWFPAMFFAAGGLLFAPAGVFLAQFFTPEWRLGTFTALMMLIAVRMLIQSIKSPEASSFVRAGSGNDLQAATPMCPLSESKRFEARPSCIGMLALSGALTGLLSGIYGVGGGFLIVPVLTSITQLTMRQAISTSLFVICVISGMGLLGYLVQSGLAPVITSYLFVLVITGAIAGMLAGTLLSKKLAGPRLQQLFVIAIVCMAVFTILNMDNIPKA